MISKTAEVRQPELQREKQNFKGLVRNEEILYDASRGHNVQTVFGFIGFVHSPAGREVIFKLHQPDW